MPLILELDDGEKIIEYYDKRTGELLCKFVDKENDRNGMEIGISIDSSYIVRQYSNSEIIYEEMLNWSEVKTAVEEWQKSDMPRC